VLDEEAAAMLDAQSGDCGANGVATAAVYEDRRVALGAVGPRSRAMPRDNLGGASRFFYCAKASTADRERGVEGDARANLHPTVKPRDLMRWLVRLVTPPGGIVLDPFAGSGSTGVACACEGFGFVGIELDPGHADVARARIAAAQQEAPRHIGEGVPKPKTGDDRQTQLFPKGDA
jgi:hypothetical protein